jgi:hypothetical protein
MDREWHERYMLAAQVRELVATGEFDETYAGLVMNPEANQVLVYRVPDHAAAFDAAVRAFSDERVQLLDAPYALAALEELRARIQQDERIRWTTLAVRADGSAVEVGVPSEDEMVRAAELLTGQPVVFEVANPVLA